METTTGRRNTKQRRVILEELRKLTSHPTASEMYQITRRTLPKISLATVYRNLELLSQTGEIQKLNLGTTEARFDGNPADHHHIRCMICGAIGDIHDLPQADLTSYPAERTDYQIVGYRLEYLGVCPKCMEEQPSGKESGNRPMNEKSIPGEDDREIRSSRPGLDNNPTDRAGKERKN